MYKRLILFSVFAVMAILFLSLFSPTSAYAMWIHPVVNGKVIYDDTPEIKWEYGDPGDESLGRVDFLGSSNNLINTEKVSIASKQDKLISRGLIKTFNSNRLLLRLFIIHGFYMLIR